MCGRTFYGIRPPRGLCAGVARHCAIANEVIPVFSRKAIFGYPAMVAAYPGIGLISLSVWAHHTCSPWA